jgi:nitrate reductase delta subunit
VFLSHAGLVDPAIRAALQSAVRTRFRLDDEAAVMTAELRCGQPGCPPLETVIAFWEPDDTRRQFRIFKPLDQIAADDLPPWWMRSALPSEDSIICSCC